MTKTNNIGIRARVLDVLRGGFLGSEAVLAYAPFIGYLVLWAFLAIQAAHKVDMRVQQIGRMRVEVKDLESEYIETKSALMQVSMESRVVSRAQALGLHKQSVPPKKIVHHE
jgi:hypothetical protein